MDYPWFYTKFSIDDPWTNLLIGFFAITSKDRLISFQAKTGQ